MPYSEEKKARIKRTHQRRVRKEVDIEREFQVMMTIIHRDASKLLDESHQNEGPLSASNAKSVIEYTKLLGSLRKQIHKDLNDMDEEELKKISNDKNHKRTSSEGTSET